MFVICDSVQKLLSLANVVSNWRLLDSPPLDTWVHPDGKLALLGDACHPMLVCINLCIDHDEVRLTIN